MIRDEQRKAFEQWATSQQFCLERFNSVDEYMNDNTHFAWEGWQAAQKVKPLNFEDDGHGGVYAQTLIGIYDIYHTSEDRELVPEGEGYYFERNCRIIKGVYATQDEAIEAANADFRKRVLSCLVNGGV